MTTQMTEGRCRDCGREDELVDGRCDSCEQQAHYDNAATISAGLGALEDLLSHDPGLLLGDDETTALISRPALEALHGLLAAGLDEFGRPAGLNVVSTEHEGEPVLGTYLREEEDVYVYTRPDGSTGHAPIDCARLVDPARAPAPRGRAPGRGAHERDPYGRPSWHVEDASRAGASRVVVQLSGAEVIAVDGLPAPVTLEVRQYHHDFWGDGPRVVDESGRMYEAQEPPRPTAEKQIEYRVLFVFDPNSGEDERHEIVTVSAPDQTTGITRALEQARTLCEPGERIGSLEFWRVV